MKIVVLICTYQCDQFFEAQLQSILNSDKGNQISEIIISDDSYDNSLSNILNNYNDARIKVVLGPKEKSAKINFLKSTINIDADWLFFSDQDDLWMEKKCAYYLNQIDEILDHNIPTVIFSDAQLIDEKDNVIAESFFEYSDLSEKVIMTDDILFQNCVQGASMCINKAMILKLKESIAFPDAYDNIAMHDWWVGILSRYLGQSFFINEALLAYRQHSNNVVGAQRKSFFNYIRYKKKYIIGFRLIRKQFIFWSDISTEMGVNFDSKKMLISKWSYIKFLFSKLYTL